MFTNSRWTSARIGATALLKALLALAVGRQTAGRVMPAGCAMREADLEVLLRLVERLGGEQRAALGRALASVSGEPEALPLHGLPQDLQRADRNLPGAAAQEGLLAALRRGARGR